MSNNKWPEYVPVFTADMIHKGSAAGPRGACCAAYWISKVFHVCHVYEVTDTLRDVNSLAAYVLLSEWNDDPRTTKSEIARALNKTMRRLGYTEVRDA